MKPAALICTILLVATFTRAALAQTDDFTTQTTDIIRLCAPSENLRVKLEGQVGGFIAKKIAGAEASGSAEVFRDGELLGRLVEASPGDATVIYQMYLDCIKPKIDKYVEARTAPGPKIIRPGGIFSANVGTSVSLFDGENFFSITGIRFGRDKKTVWKVLTTMIGGGSTSRNQLSIGDGAAVHTKRCLVVLVGVDNSTYTFRFALQCSK